MASWSDTQPLTLSPYVSKVDPELYGKVINYKQQQYDKGVQQIQSAYDNVGGLDILHPFAKEYYKQQYQQVKSQLNELANADFSNASIVNQATGLATSLLKDDNIQNAVTSTQNIRALLKSQNEKMQKGEYAPQAKNRDDKAINDYLQNPDYTRSYQGPTVASHYYDHNKELGAYLKDLAPDVSYSVTKNGDIDVSTIKSTSLGPEKIRAAIEGFYHDNPHYLNSARMDAEYIYGNLSEQDLEGVRKNFLLEAEMHFAYKKENLLKEKELAANNPSEIKRIEQQLLENELNYKYRVEQLSKDDNLIYNLYNENQINTAVNKYEKDLEIEEKESIANKNFVELLKMGLKQTPNGVKPIQYGDAEYAAWERIQENEKKKSKEGDENSSPITANFADLHGEGQFTQDNINEKIGNIDRSINTVKTDLMHSLGHSNLNITKEWLSKQAEKVKKADSKDPPDPKYLEYVRQTQDLEIQRDLLNNTLKEAMDKVNKNTDIKPLIIYDKMFKNGKLGIDPIKHKGFLDLFVKINKELDQLDKEGSKSIKPAFGFSPMYAALIPKIPATKEDREAVFAKYKNDPNIGLIKSLYDSYSNSIFSGNSETPSSWNTLLKYVNNYNTTLNKNIDNELLSSGLAQDFKIYGLPTKTEEVNKQRNEIVTALNEQNKSNDALTIDVSKITPTGQFVDYATDQVYYVYQDETGISKKVMIPGKSPSTVPGYEPGFIFRKAIESSRNPQNPTKTATKPLITANGKIRYSVSWDPLYKKYQLKAFLPNSESSIDIPGIEGFNSVNDARKAVEEFSNVINERTGRPYPVEDIQYRLQHTPEEFTNYINEKYK